MHPVIKKVKRTETIVIRNCFLITSIFGFQKITIFFRELQNYWIHDPLNGHNVSGSAIHPSVHSIKAPYCFSQAGLICKPDDAIPDLDVLNEGETWSFQSVNNLPGIRVNFTK